MNGRGRFYKSGVMGASAGKYCFLFEELSSGLSGHDRKYGCGASQPDWVYRIEFIITLAVSSATHQFDTIAVKHRSVIDGDEIKPFTYLARKQNYFVPIFGIYQGRLG